MSDYKQITKAELRAIAEKEGIRIGKRLYKELATVNPYYGDTFIFNYKGEYKFKPSKKEIK